MHNEQFIFSRTWDEVGFLAKKRTWYEEQQRILPGWYYRQEHEASFELPAGAVFQNVDFGPYPMTLQDQIAHQPNLSGMDWNPVGGHWISTIKLTPSQRDIVVVGERALGRGYAVELQEQMWELIRPWGYQGNSLVYEESGLNEEYVKWLLGKLDAMNWRDPAFYGEEWDSAGVNKYKTITWIIQTGACIHCDRERFPVLAKQIEDCSWDPDATEPKVRKDPANSPHALDAFLHACSDLNRAPAVYEVYSY